jgi:hypothetical protein
LITAAQATTRPTGGFLVRDGVAEFGDFYFACDFQWFSIFSQKCHLQDHMGPTELYTPNLLSQYMPHSKGIKAMAMTIQVCF